MAIQVPKTIFKKVAVRNGIADIQIQFVCFEGLLRLIHLLMQRSAIVLSRAESSQTEPIHIPLIAKY